MMSGEKTKIIVWTLVSVVASAIFFCIIWLSIPRFSTYLRFYSFWSPGWVEVKLTDGSLLYGRLVGFQNGFIHLLDLREPEVFVKEETNEQRYWLVQKQSEMFLGSGKVVSWNFVDENSEIFNNLSR
jgi:small nuclear ribonucleoprotein (snRNP)-like protein